jgi:serine/threonine protein kinase
MCSQSVTTLIVQRRRGQFIPHHYIIALFGFLVLILPTCLLQYRTGRTLGSGTYAIVKEAIHIKTGKYYACKVINKKLMEGREHMVSIDTLPALYYLAAMWLGAHPAVEPVLFYILCCQ